MLKHRSSSGGINSSNFSPNKVACQHTMRSNGQNGNTLDDRLLPRTSGGIFEDYSNHGPASRPETSDVSSVAFVIPFFVIYLR